jgi:hypothetical protein
MAEILSDSPGRAIVINEADIGGPGLKRRVIGQVPLAGDKRPSDHVETESHIRGLDEVGQGRLSRMVAGFAEVIEKEEFFVAGARYAPNLQYLSIPFRSKLIHSSA